MKPWTWKQLAAKTTKGESCEAFVKKYGEIGAVALELASRVEFPTENTSDWEEFTQECGCAMCKQWHVGLSDELVWSLYASLYKKAYGK
jgi:hypothetical protein